MNRLVMVKAENLRCVSTSLLRGTRDPLLIFPSAQVSSLFRRAAAGRGDRYASITRSTGGSRKRNGFRSLLRLGRAGVVERDDVHFPNRLFQQGLGNDSDVPRIFVLNLACASG